MDHDDHLGYQMRSSNVCNNNDNDDLFEVMQQDLHDPFEQALP